MKLYDSPRRWIVPGLLAAAIAGGLAILSPRTLIIETDAEEPGTPPDGGETLPFSPRPNRAREIHWKAWSPEVFEEAKKAGKPVVISLSATWCQKCHEMDEKAFSDPRVIEVLNTRYICMRVDTDRHPDVKDRYLSNRGWPTTAFCTSSGDVMAKVWYNEPDDFLKMATQTAEGWEKDPEGAKKLAAMKAPLPPGRNAAAIELIDEILAAMDSTWAADGTGWAAGEYRFPSPYSIQAYAWKGVTSGDKAWLDRAEEGAEWTARIEDPVEFGYYRVAMKPDWSDPHFEKLLETNSTMLAALVMLGCATEKETWIKSASRIVEYMNTRLALKEGGWASSQDADPDYFVLDAKGRAGKPAPHVDPSFYAGINAEAASAYLAYAAVAGDRAARTAGLAALDRIFRELWTEKGLKHGAGGGTDLLRDLALVGEACLDAHQTTGEGVWVERAQGVARRMLLLADADGAMFDRPPDPAGPGPMRFPYKKSPDNARAAGFLLRLHHMDDDAAWQKAAEGALMGTGGEAKKYPAYSPEYALALARLRRFPLHIVIVGPKEDLGPMIAAADRFWHPWKTVRILESKGETVKYAGLEYPPKLAAYACVSEACGPPVMSASKFDEEIRAFVERNK